MRVEGVSDGRWGCGRRCRGLAHGKFAPVLLLIPSASVGPPLRWRLEGEYEHEELASMAVLDAMVAMTHRSSERKGRGPDWGGLDISFVGSTLLLRRDFSFAVGL